MRKIAFFGLGNMGLPIACNLSSSGHIVRCCVHRDSAGPAALQAAGGIICPTVSAAVQDADLLFSIVPDDRAMGGLLLDEALLEALPAGCALVEMTSCSARAMATVAQAYAARGIDVLDAPVSGGVTGAANRSMTMICAGNPDLFAKLRPLLAQISAQQCYVGSQPGDGKKVKSLNNLLSAMQKVASAEVLHLAEATGLDMEAFYKAVSASSGDSAAFRALWPKTRSGDFTPGFTMALMRKDVGLALDLAEGLDLPLAQLTYAAYAADAALDKLDSTAVYLR